jgi:tetratricopeptide (TPR) repeat protein
LDDPHWLASTGERVRVAATKPALLLCFLALEGAWVSRARLALLLRPDAEPAVALHAVRLLLNRAKALSWAGALEVETSRVRFAVDCDVARFRAAISRADWTEALEAHQRPLLEGYDLHGDDLGARLHLERERLEAQWLEAARGRAVQLEAGGEYAGALGLWQACLERDPLLEDAVRGVMRAALGSGQRALGVDAYRRFEALLKQELDAAPSSQTRDLLHRLETSSALTPAPRAGHSLRAARLIGREAEIARLRASSAGVVVVSGEPGIGKTRFLRECLPPDAPWLRGVEGLERVALEPLLTFARLASPALRAGLGAYQSDLARLLPEDGHDASSDAGDQEGGKVRVLEAFARLLEASGAVVAVDDLQWVDESSLEVLIYTVARGRVRVYATLRQDEISAPLQSALRAWRAQVIRLEPWSEALTARFTESVLGANPPPAFSAWLQRATGGNAFFALEVLKHLSETGRLTLEGFAGDQIVDVPALLEDVVLRRVARLTPNAGRVAGAAAVLGDGATPAHLGALTDLPTSEVVDALDALEGAGIWGGSGFQHDLARQAVYGSLSQTRRRAWHGGAATLEDLGSARRADHALLAGQPERALELFVDAGTALLRRGLLPEARRTLERALDCDADHAPTLALLAGIAAQMGDEATADAFSHRALERARDPLTRARALNVRAGLLYNAGRVNEAAPVIEEALRLATDLERDDADLEETAFDIFEAQERYNDAIATLEPAVTRLRHFGDSGALSMCLSALGAIHDDLGRYDEALRLHFEALEVATRAGSGYARVGASVQMIWGLNRAGRAEDAVRIASEALELGEYSNTEYLRNGLAASLLQLGRVREATALFEHNALHGQVTTRTLAWGRLANLHADAGRMDEARRCATRSLETALHTQVFFARIRAAIAVLRYGTDAEVERILPLVHGQRSPDVFAQAEFEAALRARLPLPSDALEALTNGL